MKRILAIMTATLALSLAACGAESGTGGTMPDADGAGGTTATDTMRGDDGVAGTGTTSGAHTASDAATNGLGTVSGALNSGREPTRYGMTNRNETAYGAGGTNSAYTATNNGGVTNGAAARRTEKDEAAKKLRYTLMLENARVHDTDGFLLDGENSSYRTF